MAYAVAEGVTRTWTAIVDRFPHNPSCLGQQVQLTCTIDTKMRDSVPVLVVVRDGIQLGLWKFTEIREYGVEDGMFVFESGRRAAGGEGLYAIKTEQANDISKFCDVLEARITQGERISVDDLHVPVADTARALHVPDEQTNFYDIA
eukprot:m.109185 g.109185  ORF g.109185 m.109185 type:complete len:147 (-) comp10688_c0_seq1:4656-5096(-)